MVLDEDWTVRANLAPPGGLIGRGLGIGTHTLEEMHPDDAVLNRSTLYDELDERLASVGEGTGPDLVVVFLDADLAT